MADILHQVQIDAPREAVYRAISTAEGVRSWLSRDADLGVTVGGNGEIRFAGGTRVLKVRLEELSPSTRVAWKVLSAAMPTWADTRVEFSMDTEDTGTKLRFAHRGFPPADELFAMSATIWASFLISMKQYLETGKGTPHPDDPLSRVRSPD
ncbi:MAG: SRPBCC domain-containing protein [Xanthomonadaceae bacterium]|nr:SRPBCC domain-containing protein [Xanthomonadaceae bacterium]